LGGEPAWSSKGLIAFVKATGRRPGNLCSNRLGIYTMNPTGRHVRQLTGGNADREPDWSPDGHGVVFARTRGATAGIYVVDEGSRALRRLTSAARGGDGDPTWSPDGTQILYVRGVDLWVMNSDGSEQRRVAAHNPSTEDGSGSYEMYATAWQPLPS
jgi:Tol biopolymer transport system component